MSFLNCSSKKRVAINQLIPRIKIKITLPLKALSKVFVSTVNKVNNVPTIAHERVIGNRLKASLALEVISPREEIIFIGNNLYKDTKTTKNEKQKIIPYFF